VIYQNVGNFFADMTVFKEKELRQIQMNKLCMNSLLSVAGTSIVFLSQAGLQVQALEAKTPNLYELRGNNIRVLYSTSSITGKPLFDYQDNRQKLHFEGDQIQTEDVAIGKLVTVTIRKTVDTGSTTFSVLIPRINLEQSNEAKISTEGVTTVQRFSTIPTSNQGQTQSYKVITLTGTAKAVQF
jgi:hypothetical protein